MNEFVDYLLKEYQLPDDVVCHKVGFTHSSKLKIDKLSNVPVSNHTITVKVDCFDKDHQKIASISERFVDGEIKRTKTKPLVNISPDELNNRFGKAKLSICSRIQSNYADKLREINDDINDLKEYCGSDYSIIPTEFVNEPKVSRGVDEPENGKSKFEF